MMYLKKNENIKNSYSLFEVITLGVSVIFTKLFYPKAKLVCYPIYMRGKQNLIYGSGLNVGYGCRFDLLNSNKKTLFIGKNCEIGDYCHFVATNEVTIGDNFLCASKVFISDTSHGEYAGEFCSEPTTPPNLRPLISKPVHIGNNVWMGDNTVILGGVSIGDGCIIGANSVVTKSFDKNCIIAGAPAKIIKKYNEQSKMWEKYN